MEPRRRSRRARSIGCSCCTGSATWGSMSGLGRRFATRGTGAILADLRGHGRSSEVPLTYGVEERHDLSAVLDAVEAAGYSLGEVGIYGPSYSGAIAIQAAAVDARFTRVVTVACFAEAERILAHRVCGEGSIVSRSSCPRIGVAR
ncbi:MAG: alpha/beta fold hydrolase [Polyangiales bacterium]